MSFCPSTRVLFAQVLAYFLPRTIDRFACLLSWNVQSFAKSTSLLHTPAAIPYAIQFFHVAWPWMREVMSTYGGGGREDIVCCNSLVIGPAGGMTRWELDWFVCTLSCIDRGIGKLSLLSNACQESTVSRSLTYVLSSLPQKFSGHVIRRAGLLQMSQR